MVDIIPAILPKSYDELCDGLDIVAGHVNAVQIDVCDGAYVSNRTWPYLKGVDADGSANDVIFAGIISQEKALPHWEELDFEFDLMVRNAHDKIPDFISAGASRITIHKHAVDDAELAAIIRDYCDLVELGVAIMPADEPAAIVAYLAPIADKIRFVQVMGIDRIGFQGQSFDARSVGLVKALKTAYPGLACVIDGHVTLDDARELVEAGADRLVIGSALFESGDFLGTLNSFYDAISA